MSKFCDGLRREGITWPQFFFQLVIILLGVYLAIFFERKAQERSLAEDTAVMLQNVVTELKQDEDELQRILGIVTKKGEVARQMADLLARASQEDAPVLDSLMRAYVDNNRTAFVRKGAYASLVSGGYLRSLARTELPALFADLYERTYNRVTVVGNMQDFNYVEVIGPAYTDHVDIGTLRFIRPGPEANVRLRNALLRILWGVDFYVGFLEDTLAQVREVKGAVEAYLAEG